MEKKEITKKIMDLSNDIVNSGKFEDFKKNPDGFLDKLNFNSEELTLASELSEDDLEKLSGGWVECAAICGTMLVVAIIQRPQ